MIGYIWYIVFWNESNINIYFFFLLANLVITLKGECVTKISTSSFFIKLNPPGKQLVFSRFYQNIWIWNKFGDWLGTVQDTAESKFAVSASTVSCIHSFILMDLDSNILKIQTNYKKKSNSFEKYNKFCNCLFD